MKYAIGIALPALIFWGSLNYFLHGFLGFGMPFAAFWILLKKKKNLFTEENRQRYGFLYEGYVDNKFYW